MNMEFILGLVTALAFFVAFEMGRRSKSTPIETPAEKKEQEIEKAVRMRQDFLNMMTYDVEKAMQGKKVTDGE